MFLLIVVGLLAGIVTSLSPCVLPVLPVVLAAGVPRRQDDQAAEGQERPVSRRSWRPYAVVAGLVISFSASTLFGSLVLGSLDLPQDLLRDVGVVVLVIIGLGLLWPRLGDLLERPFARVPGRAVNPDGNGIVLGLGLGLLFVPCAGPVLATIAVVGASHRVNGEALVLTAAFGVGVGVPLLVLALAGDKLARRTGVLRRHARSLRTVGGVVMIVVAALIGLNLTDGLQRAVPGYTNALQNALTRPATDQLRTLAGGGSQPTDAGPGCSAGATSLVDCGQAPELTGITGWLNTPGDQPLSLAALRGKVVLIDFWTYSCINCQRTLPHVQTWYSTYQNSGFVVIGVHTPEFAFEHVASNIAEQAPVLGVHYPIAIDNDYGTWNAYHNEYWPAEYLIDAAGVIRHVSFGEGGYADTEALIRQLLAQRDPAQVLPPPTEVPDTTPTRALTEETYLGYHYAPLHVSGTAPDSDGSATYRFPTTVDPDTFALDGTWKAGPEALTAGSGARLQLNAQARDVYLVLGGQGSVSITADGMPARTVTVSGPPTLYPVLSQPDGRRVTINLAVSPGVQAYDFTFG
ncbi:cytochrome c biogenesis protein DipZ [Pseudonocardia spinosispora]|uniref:cytochrome c biogenesis protein DipZ n=1 Tax=Pseudonocardia spinosispora TaxID=103441 RepID=UPI0004137FF5|nr:cytochrome c biogenesis protein DipZ [Pseudonocardia spinosispora]